MTAEARQRLGELQDDVKTLLARHLNVKAQINNQEREISYSARASEAWKHRAELRILYCMARILVRRINGLRAGRDHQQ
jgi:hypothetical protein